METDSEAVALDNFICFSEGIFIQMMIRIIQIVVASGLPTSERKLKWCNRI